MAADDQLGPQQRSDDSATEPIVQYILVRTDLKWGTGATIAQACHASSASIYKTLNNPSTIKYLSDLENMHKIILKADKLDDILNVETRLKEANIPYHLWIEQPENVASSLAVSPQPKNLVQAIFRHLKLFK